MSARRRVSDVPPLRLGPTRTQEKVRGPDPDTYPPPVHVTEDSDPTERTSFLCRSTQVDSVRRSLGGTVPEDTGDPLPLKRPSLSAVGVSVRISSSEKPGTAPEVSFSIRDGDTSPEIKKFEPSTPGLMCGSPHSDRKPFLSHYVRLLGDLDGDPRDPRSGSRRRLLYY